MPLFSLDTPSGAPPRLGPGTRILVGAKGAQHEQCTVTTVFRRGGTDYGITAGHALTTNDQVFDLESRRLIGTRVVNLLNEPTKRDLAVFRVEPNVHFSIPTHHASLTGSPQPGHAFTVKNGSLRPTRVSSNIFAKPVYLLAKLGSHLPLIECIDRVLGPGDSGAPLYQSRDGKTVLIGLHSGSDPDSCYFTPTDDVIQEALKSL